mgnify:CR=1 FL=1
MRNNGKNFEIQTKRFFSKLLNEIGFIVNKERIQFNGTQDGFDVQFVVSQDYIERVIYIECKDYSTDLKFGAIYSKVHDLESNYSFNNNDLALFISPRANFGNTRNPEKAEPILNKFPFTIRLLEQSNGIENLFAIDKEIYQEIYNKKCEIQVNSQTEIDKFKSIIFSRGGFRKIIVKEEHKTIFLSNAKECINYIPRKVNKENRSETSTRQLYHNHNQNSKSLISYFENNLLNPKSNGLVLLGNPGLGKSVELRELALYFWEHRNENQIVPFYRVINSFTSSNEIIDFLPKDWGKIPKLLIILDGLDEISHIREFKSKLHNFILDNNSDNQKIRFLLSCRTNIFENIVKSISNFEYCFLDRINYYDAIRFLESNFNLSKNDFSNLYINEDQREFLENPYYLNLFGEYYAENGKLPDSKTDLIERYIQKRLEDDRVEKYQNKDFDKSIIITSCKKIALTMEAMQLRVVEDSKLTSLITKNKMQLINSCFIEKVFNADKWQFEHKNLQEYFVSKALIQLPFSDIISFISLDASNDKTHPSWLNSISYLINSLDSKNEIYKNLIKWLKKNDSEVLFKSDSDRISEEIRTDVFQEYFTKRCIEDTLWIRSYDSGVYEIAKFGNNISNVSFLIDEIKKNSNHRRARISAFDLLSHMDLDKKVTEVKLLTLFYLNESNNEFDLDAKSDIIRFSIKLNFHLDELYLIDLLKKLKGNDYHRITSAVFDLFCDDIPNKNLANPNDHLDYFKSITPQIAEIKERTYKKERNFMSHDKQKLKKILLKLEGINSILYSLKYLLLIKNPLDVNEGEIIDLVKKLADIYKPENTVLPQLVNFIYSSIKERNYFYNFEEHFANFFIITNTQFEGFKKLYSLRNKIGMFYIPFIADESAIFLLFEDFKKNILDEKQIKGFRNILSYKNFELSLKFQSLIIEGTSYDFDGDVLSLEIANISQNFYAEKEKLSFELLFNKNKIIEIISDFFKYLKLKKLSWEDKHNFRKVYWKSIELQKRFPESFLNIVNRALQSAEEDFIDANNVSETLNEELFLIKAIREYISSNNNTNIKLTSSQHDYILSWCLQNLSIADFKSNLSLENDRCSLLWYFRNRFNLDYPEDTLLEMLLIDGKMKNNENFHGINYIEQSVNKKLLDERVILNIKNKLTHELIKKNHFLYAIENKLKEVFPIIEDDLLEDQESSYYKKIILAKYFQINSNIKLLKEISDKSINSEISDDIVWSVFDLLLSKNENKYVINKLLKYRSADKENTKDLKTIKYLVKANYEDAFKLFNIWLKTQKVYNRNTNNPLRTEDFPSHKNLKSIPHLIELIKIYYGKDEYKFDDFGNPIRFIVEAFQAIAQNNSSDDCTKIIKELQVCKEFLSDKNIDMFFINTILRDLKEIYIKLKSKPMSFSEIAKKMEDYEYYLV